MANTNFKGSLYKALLNSICDFYKDESQQRESSNAKEPPESFTFIHLGRKSADDSEMSVGATGEHTDGAMGIEDFPEETQDFLKMHISAFQDYYTAELAENQKKQDPLVPECDESYHSGVIERN